MRTEEELSASTREAPARQWAEVVLAAFTRAVETAVSAHLAAGRSVYQLDERGQVIESRAAAAAR